MFFSTFSQSEREEFEAEHKEKYERERVLLTEENKKLSSELDKVKIFAQIHRVQLKPHICTCWLSFSRHSGLAAV